MEHTSTEAQSLVTAFPADLAHANHSLHTCRAYAADLAQLCGFHQGPIQTITADVLRTFFECMPIFALQPERANRQR